MLVPHISSKGGIGVELVWPDWLDPATYWGGRYEQYRDFQIP